MATDMTTIYRFPNATLIQWFGSYSRDATSLFEDGVIVPELTGLLSEGAMNSLGKYSYRLHEATSGELELNELTWSREVASYLPADESAGLRELTEADYEKLNSGFQRLYKKKFSDPEEVRTLVQHELREVPFELQEDFLTGKAHPTELHAVVQPIRERERRSNSYSNYGRDKHYPELRNNLPLDLDSEEILKVIGFMGSKISAGSGYGATLELNNGYRTPSELKVNFFAAPYTGELRKVFATKTNGQHYADGRGRMVKNLPKIVGTAIITTGDMSNWWTAIAGNKLTDEAKFEALEELTRHLWLV